MLTYQKNVLSIVWAIMASSFTNLQDAQGVSIAKVQEDGVFSNKAFLRLKDGLPRNLIDFTLCTRLSLNYLRGSRNYWLSLGNLTHDTLLTGAYVVNEKETLISVQRYHPMIQDEISLRFENGFNFQEWEHFCFVFQSFAQVPYPGGNINLTTKAYFNGEFIREVTKVVPKSSFVEIAQGATLLLGQKQDNSRKEYDVERSFSGRYADLSFWRGQLVSEEIKALANCKSASNRGIIVDWDVSKYEFDSNHVSVETYKNNDQPCSKANLHGRALFNYGAPRDNFKFLCDKLDGQLPVFKTQEERTKKYQAIKGLFLNTFDNFTCLLTDQGVEQDQKEVFFWTGIEEDTNRTGNLFIDAYSQKPVDWDVNLFPGPAAGDIKCTMVRGKEFLAKEKCDSELPCGYCEFHPKKKLLLKGLCIGDLSENGDFDTEYYVSGMKNERPHFRGLRASHIYFNDTDQTWVLASLRSPGKRSLVRNDAFKTGFPLGRTPWTLLNTNPDQKGICNLRNGEQHFLAFSDCYPDRFTCTNGECIDLEQKCNSVLDCQDGSDEEDCEFLMVDESYAKDKLPKRGNEKSPLEVFFSIDIGAFPEIDSTNFKVNSDYDINLRWYDPRLKFRDLNNETKFNGLNAEESTHLWSPKLEFVNALGPVKQDRDDFGSLRLIKEETEALPQDFSLSREARLYSGEKNSISLQRRYSLDHSCEFDLYYYPFDTQVCPMVFELRDKTEDFIQFNKDQDPIKYRGSRSLSQYEIATEELEITRNERNFSTALVKVVLRHRTEFHVANSFVQTLIVLIVAFATFFFDLNDFSDRIMVNTVLLLVMATINASIQNHVPVTSYFKLIDVWLLFCVVVIVIVIVFHTILAALFTGSGPRKGDNLNSKSAFQRIRTPSGSLTTDTQGLRETFSGDDSPVGRIANWTGMIIVLVIIIIFNIVFWVIALKEFNMDSAQILIEKKPIR
ncbi:uncharacterized protein LOC131883401 isoform X1 [Tigriopus californicus]|nr:uncharacterized protein LOC131883401 isoform X1 [Tigriopus californicus]XP_059086862.1 uncharacterized protein LOC131883401 isoform X1 [Tigriopus californicus]